MPDLHGRLTEEDRAKVFEWWKSRWKGPVQCPVCKTDDWSVADYIVALNRHAIDGQMAGTPGYLLLQVNCQTCSHTMFFNAVQMGIVPIYDPAADPTFVALPPPPEKD